MVAKTGFEDTDSDGVGCIVSERVEIRNACVVDYSLTMNFWRIRR